MNPEETTMKKRSVVPAFVLLLATTAAGWALDTVVQTTKTKQGGRVVGMSPIKVDLEQGAGITKEIPVNQVVTILFEDDPGELKIAKTHVVAGRFAEAQQALERIKDDVGRPEIQQDIDFYKALCAARLALGGSGKIADAGRMMKAFADADAHKGSYHYFEASEAAGDLLVAVRQYGLAAEYYARLEKAPWTDYKMRAGAAAGRALLAQGKTDEALKSFDKVLATEASGELADAQRAMANLGKAGVLTAAKKPDEAIKIVDAVLQKADPEDVQVMARAYNVLGTAQRQAGRTKEALLAFLHVDVLYSGVPEAHAEALANLADLWGQFHKAERAQRARKTLEEQYPDSPWVKKGG